MGKCAFRRIWFSGSDGFFAYLDKYNLTLDPHYDDSILDGYLRQRRI